MSEQGYRVKGTTRGRIRESDVLVYVHRAGHAGARIEWGEPEGMPGVPAAAIMVGDERIDAVYGESREEVLLCLLVCYAHIAAKCNCAATGEKCPAALSAAYDLGRGLDG